MHYAFEFTVEPAHTVDSPLVEVIVLGSGILRNVEIHFPVGCNGCVRCCVLNDAVQLLPVNQDGFYSLDGEAIKANLWYDLVANTNRLYFVCWSVDAGYNHRISVLLDVKEDNEPDMVIIQSKVVELMDHIISLIKSYF